MYMYISYRKISHDINNAWPDDIASDCLYFNAINKQLIYESSSEEDTNYEI